MNCLRVVVYSALLTLSMIVSPLFINVAPAAETEIAAAAAPGPVDPMLLAKAEKTHKRTTVKVTHKVRVRRRGSSPLGLWEDRSTGQLFTRPGKGRVPYLDGKLENVIEKKVEAKDQAIFTKELTRVQDQNHAVNAAFASEIQSIQPAWRDYVDRFFKKFRIGATFYADYGMYTHTGFGPQFLENQTPPGPGNNYYNTFDVTRTYLNFYFTPTEDWTLRITPDIYRSTGAAASGTKEGRISAFGSNLDGDLNYRLKYGLVEYNKPFKWFKPMADNKIAFGVLPNAFIPWEEDLTGFRYVYLVPWNYTSLSSGQGGISVHGPIKYHELQYFDYDIGAYNNASFRAIEQTNTKQVMVRGSLYPLGAKSRFDGLGITGFYDYGYANTTPDNNSLAGPSSGQRQGHVSRIAALIHYTAETWQLVGEYDDGHNAFTSGNFFSGSGPFDEFGGSGATPGGATATTCVGTGGAAIPSCFTAWDSLIKAIQNNGGSHQQGYAFFARAQIPTFWHTLPAWVTGFTAFGMFQEFLPNTKVDHNPIDFQRWVAGLEYKWSKNLRFSLDSDNLLFPHDQFTFPASEANLFAPNIITTPLFSAPPGPVGTKAFPFPVDIPFAVPRDTHGVFFHLEFTF